MNVRTHRPLVICYLGRIPIHFFFNKIIAKPDTEDDVYIGDIFVHSFQTAVLEYYPAAQEGEVVVVVVVLVLVLEKLLLCIKFGALQRTRM